MNQRGEINDPDVRLLVGLAATLEPDYAPKADDPWAASPFKWILSQPSRTKGAVGESLIAGWAAAKGFDVLRSPDSEADRVIEGHRIEIKFSTLWKNGGFKFQQIRDQEYDFCFCLGLSPFDAQAWLIPKPVLQDRPEGLVGQHTGAAGQDTSWLSFQADGPYRWMTGHGGRLGEVERLLHVAGRGPHRGRQ